LEGSPRRDGCSVADDKGDPGVLAERQALQVLVLGAGARADGELLRRFRLLAEPD
jgi:hypothetical protein